MYVCINIIQCCNVTVPALRKEAKIGKIGAAHLIILLNQLLTIFKMVHIGLDHRLPRPHTYEYLFINIHKSVTAS